jgi:hypothetical protein
MWIGHILREWNTDILSQRSDWKIYDVIQSFGGHNFGLAQGIVFSYDLLQIHQ